MRFRQRDIHSLIICCCFFVHCPSYWYRKHFPRNMQYSFSWWTSLSKIVLSIDVIFIPTACESNTEHGFLEEGGLIRELSLTSSLNFYLCTTFRQSRSLPEAALSCRWAVDDCIVSYRTRGGKGTKVKQLHCLLFLRFNRQMDCACKNLQLTDLTVLMKYLVSFPLCC